MNKIIIVGIFAFLVSALGYAVCQKSKESEELEDDNASDINNKKNIFNAFNNMDGYIDRGIIEHVKILDVKYLISKVKSMMAKKNVKKVAVMEFEKLIKECPGQSILSELEGDVDAIFASVDEYGNIEEVECVSADIIDPSYQAKLGDEGMIVING